ncbi:MULTISPECIES: HNH endonuclease [unclassified Pseudomonas]|uniref:HNH endonuclease n=1 Tax=unclassified Pseudomonas TaxID=196821 RepID=UPI000C87AE83|nr:MULTISPECIES: HNH endonuclease [unclassified Pseudomonas]MBD9599717.1 HNH endonuclease [Pseudomonas sp. PDM10]PMU12481.1 hypothetical protein C1Y11_00435 [Pseudomonas sp. FW305-20]PMU22389.1 hypothetical protein C1Y10_01090 [Pseudomonas sp. FW305-122]PMU43592.1 hypothetical protein C1Y12_02290 [Pseudomonas sp. FW305-47B]PMX64931.1 hypothetical protein C1Y13_02980 [Pseudomonas sp. FW305-33]
MISFTAMPSLTDLQARYKIDPESPSGLSRTKATTGRNGKVGPVVSIGSDGYYRMQFNGQFYRTHRVIYYMHTGIDPAELVVDHRDGDCLNNNVENLRACTQQQNTLNKKAYKKASGLPKGISKLPNGWYRAQVSINGEPQVAHLANIRAAQCYLKTRRKESHGEYARNV